MTSTMHSVISGVSCPVTSVAGREASSISDFLGETEFVLDMAGSAYLVRGCGSSLDERVRFHEKDDLSGKDVRVWHVVPTRPGFSAEHIAAF